jgi:hypothetical protein
VTLLSVVGIGREAAKAVGGKGVEVYCGRGVGRVLELGFGGLGSVWQVGGVGGRMASGRRRWRVKCRSMRRVV